jgi:hypothetical protein
MKNLFLSLTICLLASVSFGQLTVEDVRAPFIKETNGTMTATEYHLVKSPSGRTTKQVVIYGETGIDGQAISRDYFAYIMGALSHLFIDEICFNLSDHGAEGTATQMKSLIGRPDIIVNLFVAEGGIQIEFVADGKTERSTMSWDDILY